MTRKDFHFDFDEEADPVEELHRLRVATARHFKTRDALMEYYRSTPPIEEIKARLETEIAEKKARAVRARNAESSERPARRRKTAKSLTPA
jgi:hypothetical protein